MPGPVLLEVRPPARRTALRAALGGLATVGVGGGALFLASLLWLPRAITYRVGAGTLRVEVRYSLITERRETPLAEIRGVRGVRLRGGHRNSGLALPGFCVGTFTYEGLGPVWQATNCGRTAVLVDIRTEKRPWVLTPADWRDFIAALQGGGERDVVPAAVEAGEGLALARWAVAALVPVVLWIPVFFFLAPARIRYRVRGGELQVVGLGRRRRWPLTGVPVRRFRPSGIFRVWGTALPGYYSGVFRTAGRTVRVAATHLGEGVLVEGSPRLFVTPPDVEQFLAVLREAGAIPGEPG